MYRWTKNLIWRILFSFSFYTQKQSQVQCHIHWSKLRTDLFSQLKTQSLLACHHVHGVYVAHWWQNVTSIAFMPDTVQAQKCRPDSLQLFEKLCYCTSSRLCFGCAVMEKIWGELLPYNWSLQNYDKENIPPRHSPIKTDWSLIDLGLFEDIKYPEQRQLWDCWAQCWDIGFFPSSCHILPLAQASYCHTLWCQ